MNRGTSPLFDVPEFPPLRRVKPLPKRRRTAAEQLILDDLVAANELLASVLPETTPDELARNFSASMAIDLQTYRMPIFSGIQDIFKNEADSLNFTDFGTGLQGDDGNGDGRDDNDQGDGDYIDHLQQPGNTKKRKVPAANISPNGETQEVASVGEEEPMSGRIPTRKDAEIVEFTPPYSSSGTQSVQRRGKLTPATNAGLQHKEMLKNRKRQLAAVLGALSHGDTLALDQALSSNYPFSKMTVGPVKKEGGGLRIRLSRRPARRIARALQASRTASHSAVSENVKLSGCDFTFEYPSATSERLIATKDEVAMLHTRFEAELSRQAAKATEAAKQAALAVTQMQKAKRADRQQRQRTAVASNGAVANEPSINGTDKSGLGSKSKGKKKKRSALANASNPHHLRNYVPSRLPHSGQVHTQTTNSQNHLGPPPLRFLSAEIPPRKKKTRQIPPAPLTQLTSPEDEWICAFCDYNLFYGDEQSYRRAIRSRKKILSRRRRARERAAAAANGNKAVAPVEPNDPLTDDVDSGYEVGRPDVPLGNSRAPRSRGDKDRDRGEAIS